MNGDVFDELIMCLDEIDARIKRLESSPNQSFVLIEFDTIEYFHEFNLNFRDYWDFFDNHSARNLLQFKTIIERHSNLSIRYENLLREQKYNLSIVFDGNGNLKETAKIKFPEHYSTEIIDYYKENCKKITDGTGNPLYDIDVKKELFKDDETGETIYVDYHLLRSDKIENALCEGLFSIYKSISNILEILSVVCNYPYDLTNNYEPNLEEIIGILEKESRQYAKMIGRDIERDLRKKAQTLKPSRNASLTPAEWGKLIDEEDCIFDLAISDQLINSNEKKFDDIDEEQRKLLTDNYSLLQKIKTVSSDEELFDIRYSVETHNILSSLTADNLDLFYDLVLRRNIIQTEMFPDKLKAEYEEWSNPSEERLSEDSEDKGLTKARQSKLDEIIGILQKGDWKAPATVENVTQLLNTIFGRDVSLLEDDDEQFCKKMWAFVESGSGNRMKVVPANLAGFFCEQNLLNGSPKSISEDIFGKGINQSNNINKGYSSRRSNTFKDVIPFITKYTDKIIRQA